MSAIKYTVRKHCEFCWCVERPLTARERELYGVSKDDPRLMNSLIISDDEVAAFQSEEDANMFAAAPDLLEACKDALFSSVSESTYPDGPCLPKHVRDELRAAIAKATASRLGQQRGME